MSSSSYSSGDEVVHGDVLLEARQACYKARDAFYSCMEMNSSKKATEVASSSVGLMYPIDCKKTRAVYQNKCRPSWVKHFDRLYCSKKRAQRFLDDNHDQRRGPLSLPQPSTFNHTPSSS